MTRETMVASGGEQVPRDPQAEGLCGYSAEWGDWRGERGEWGHVSGEKKIPMQDAFGDKRLGRGRDTRKAVQAERGTAGTGRVRGDLHGAGAGPAPRDHRSRRLTRDNP